MGSTSWSGLGHCSSFAAGCEQALHDCNDCSVAGPARGLQQRGAKGRHNSAPRGKRPRATAGLAMGSDADDGVQAPESPLAKQHSGAMRGSATTSVPGSPSEDAAATAEAGARRDADGQAAVHFRPAEGTAAANGGQHDDEAASDGGSIYPDSDDEDGNGGGSFARETDARGLQADRPAQDAQQQLQQALARISQLEDQNVALWQVRCARRLHRAHQIAHFFRRIRT